jgi:hypothetical protein
VHWFTQLVIHANVRAYLKIIKEITQMKQFYRVSEIFITCLTLILLIYYSLFNYAAERNSESRIGDDEFFIKELQRYFVVEIIVILMIIFIVWRLIKPTIVLTTISRSIILFLAIFVPLCILLGFSYKILHI